MSSFRVPVESPRILHGDALERLRELPDESVRCVVTSPPYWGLRDYGVAEQLGMEKTPEEYVAKATSIFAEIRRVLRRDGTLWLNIGDCYMGGGRGGGAENCKQRTNVGSLDAAPNQRHPTIKQKDLVGVPWMLAFALRADGWFLRSEIIWAKPNPMPESVTDRPTKAHEQVFLLSKSRRYFYNAEAVKETATSGARGSRFDTGKTAIHQYGRSSSKDRVEDGKRNLRSVWRIVSQPYAGAHFAVFPEELARRCILAGTEPGDVVLDPFGGSGTTAVVASLLGRKAILIELNPAYVALATERLRSAPAPSELNMELLLEDS